jgi:hypothetical protein
MDVAGHHIETARSAAIDPLLSFPISTVRPENTNKRA